MNKMKLLKVLYWVCFALVVAAFYVGLRTKEYQLEYTLIALVLWGVSYGLNVLIKKEKVKVDSE